MPKREQGPGRPALPLRLDLGPAPVDLGILAVALEEIPAAVFVVDGAGRTCVANASARALLAGDPGLAENLERSVLAHEHNPFCVVPLPGPAEHPLFVVAHRGGGGDLAGRIGRAQRRWSLTERQLQVLAELVRGHGNKHIASALRCTERTVEAHVTSLLAKTRAGSRLALVAQFWLST